MVDHSGTRCTRRFSKQFRELVNQILYLWGQKIFRSINWDFHRIQSNNTPYLILFLHGIKLITRYMRLPIELVNPCNLTLYALYLKDNHLIDRGIKVWIQG
jgi:hypothetical protein